MLSQAVEDYLKTILEVQRDQGKVATTVLADRMGVAPASATGMIKKLAGLKLVRHNPYQGVVLTRAGEKVALEVLRHHRLLELYLAEALGYTWDQVHEEACRLEHVISEEFEDKIFEALGGRHAIPTASRFLPRTAGCRAWITSRSRDLQPGATGSHQSGQQERSGDAPLPGSPGTDPGGRRSKVVEKAPFEGPLHCGRELVRRVGSWPRTLPVERAAKLRAIRRRYEWRGL